MKSGQIAKTNAVLEYFDEILPNARCALNYNKDYELVIAVMLSAQTTDVAVNKVTSFLFEKYNDLSSLANAKIEDIEEIIKSLGLYKKKAQNILDIANILVKNFNSKVPSDKNDLMKLPGVGNKTANVIRIELFKIPEIPVDTHIARIAKRLGFAGFLDTPTQIEGKLRDSFNQENWIKLHHQLIWFGRTQCKAINPDCKTCKLKKYCNYK